MSFEHSKTIGNFGEKVGFIFSYLLFTTVIFFLFSLLGKLPSDWSYIHIMLITSIITFIGLVIGEYLK